VNQEIGKKKKKGFALPNKLFGFQSKIFSVTKQSINKITQNQPHKQKCEKKRKEKKKYQREDT
jgi:nicotinic acid phosphoribosyltransferase